MRDPFLFFFSVFFFIITLNYYITIFLWLTVINKGNLEK
jgi:hypothetical protein